MANFRKVLLKEQQRLEKIKKKAEEQLKMRLRVHYIYPIAENMFNTIII